jgi:Winged helix DNA-binding domain
MIGAVDIARWRLRSQHLVTPHETSASAVVGSLLAVQAENPSQAAWAVAARTRKPSPADLAAQLDDASVVRIHILR